MPRRPARPRPVTSSRRAASPDVPPRTVAIDPLAEPLHRNALHLLRLLRREDEATGVSAARLSALSVLVFGGPASLGALAAAEQVSAPTMTRLVQQLEREGWVRRETDPSDARAVRLAATPAAVRLLHRGRERRLAALSRAIAALPPADRAAIADSLGALERLARTLRERGTPGSPPTTLTDQAHTRDFRRVGRRRFD